MSKQVKLMIFSDWFVPGYKAGGPIRSITNFCLSMTNYLDIYVFTSDRDLGDNEAYKGIVPNTWINWREEVKVLYASPDWMTLENIKKEVNEISPDFLYLNSMFSIKYTILPLWLFFRKTFSSQLVWAPRGMLQKGAIQYKRIRKLIFISLLKLVGLPDRIIFHATNVDEEKDVIQYMGREVRRVVIPNLTLLPPEKKRILYQKGDKLKLGSIARISPVKNLLFLLEAFKHVHVEVSLDLWGPIEDDKYWKKCQKVIPDLPENIEVNYQGKIVPEEVGDKLSDIHVFVLPTFGENFGHSIFEALSMGVPVLISDRTPTWRELVGKKAGWDLPFEQERWANQIEEIANMDMEEYLIWTKGARRLAEKIADKKIHLEAYKSLFSKNESG
ncbi:MAG: glycosyltransferase family 4 protein [Bacteroidota bacterium]